MSVLAFASASQITELWHIVYADPSAFWKGVVGIALAAIAGRLRSPKNHPSELIADLRERLVEARERIAEFTRREDAWQKREDEFIRRGDEREGFIRDVLVERDEQNRRAQQVKSKMESLIAEEKEHGAQAAVKAAEVLNDP